MITLPIVGSISLRFYLSWSTKRQTYQTTFENLDDVRDLNFVFRNREVAAAAAAACCP